MAPARWVNRRLGRRGRWGRYQLGGLVNGFGRRGLQQDANFQLLNVSAKAAGILATILPRSDQLAKHDSTPRLNPAGQTVLPPWQHRGWVHAGSGCQICTSSENPHCRYKQSLTVSDVMAVSCAQRPRIPDTISAAAMPVEAFQDANARVNQFGTLLISVNAMHYSINDIVMPAMPQISDPTGLVPAVNLNCAPSHTNPKRKRGPRQDMASLARRVGV